MISGEHKDVSNHQQLGCLFNKDIIQDPTCWFYVKGNHQWPADFPHEAPALRKPYPCLNITTMSIDLIIGTQRNVLALDLQAAGITGKFPHMTIIFFLVKFIPTDLIKVVMCPLLNQMVTVHSNGFLPHFLGLSYPLAHKPEIYTTGTTTEVSTVGEFPVLEYEFWKYINGAVL